MDKSIILASLKHQGGQYDTHSSPDKPELGRQHQPALQAQELLTRVEAESVKVGLWLNAKKTEAINYNIPLERPLLTTEDTALKDSGSQGRSSRSTCIHGSTQLNETRHEVVNMSHGTPSPIRW